MTQSSLRELLKTGFGAQTGLWDNSARALRCQNGRGDSELSGAGQVLQDQLQDAASAGQGTRAERAALKGSACWGSPQQKLRNIPWLKLSSLGWEHMQRNKEMWTDWMMFTYYLINRNYRQCTGVSLLPGNDVAFLWLQLLEQAFSFQRIWKPRSSDLRELRTDLGPLRSQPTAPTHNFSDTARKARVLSVVRDSAPSLSYTPIHTRTSETHVCMRALCRYLDNVYIYAYTYTHTYEWNISTYVFSGHWERKDRNEIWCLPWRNVCGFYSG